MSRLPYSVKTGVTAITQIGQELEEAAELAGASWTMRFRRIIMPLASSGVLSGMMVSFVGVMRELSLIILLITPSTRVLMTVGFGYAEEGLAQLSNALVLIVPTASTAGPMNFSGAPVLAAMVGDGRLAMGDPDFVPAGVYAKAALQALGEWEALASRIAPAANVRAALALVERGEVPLGIVYVTDARASAQVRIVGHLPNDSHAPIVYPAALVSGAPPAAAELLAFLAGPEGAAIFAVHGFSAPRVAEGG